MGPLTIIFRIFSTQYRSLCGVPQPQNLSRQAAYNWNRYNNFTARDTNVVRHAMCCLFYKRKSPTPRRTVLQGAAVHPFVLAGVIYYVRLGKEGRGTGMWREEGYVSGWVLPALVLKCSVGLLTFMLCSRFTKGTKSLTFLPVSCWSSTN